MWNVNEYNKIQEDREGFKKKYGINDYAMRDIESCPPEMLASCLPIKALIALEKEGVLSMTGYNSFTLWTGLILVEYDENYVFGYYSIAKDGGETKHYFRVKLRMTSYKDASRENKYYFIWGGMRQFLDEFMRRY